MKIFFSAVSAVIGTWLVLGAIAILRTSSRATGLAAVLGGAIESLFSPLFWILAIALFYLLFTAGRARSTPVRAVFYWLPTAVIWTVVLAFLALGAYAWMRFRQG